MSNVAITKHVLCACSSVTTSFQEKREKRGKYGMICVPRSPSPTSVSSGEALTYSLSWVAMHPVKTWGDGLVTGRRERPELAILEEELSLMSSQVHLYLSPGSVCFFMGLIQKKAPFS